MSYMLSIQPEAAGEFYGSIEWYDAQSAGLGSRFKQEILATLRNVVAFPEVASFIKGKYQQAIVPDFPFVIVYKVSESAKKIYVSSIFHTSRNPKKKFRRQRD